jgi:hypothetical protein
MLDAPTSKTLLCKIREQEGRTGSAWKWEGVGRGVQVAQTIRTHIRKCKSDKIKRERKKSIVQT